MKLYQQIVLLAYVAVGDEGVKIAESALSNSHHHHDYERTPVECKCPKSYTVVGDRCERYVQSPQESICPSGFQIAQGKCIRQKYPDEQCPYGFARVRNECVKRDLTIPQLACAGDYTLEATANWGKKDQALVCVSQIPVEPVLECPDGTPYRGVCNRAVTIPALYTCPQGFNQTTPSTCNRYEKVECGYKAPARHLRAVGDHPIAAQAVATHGAWDGDVWKAATYGTPAVSDHYHEWHGDHHHYGGSRTTIDTEQTCFANVTIPASPYCRKGELRGRLCLVPSTTEAVPVCPAYGTPSKCFAFDRQAPRSICPEGYTEECVVGAKHLSHSIDCDCVKLTTEPVMLTCPPGAHLLDGMCTTFTEPIVGCPIGTHAVGKICQRPEHTYPICTYEVQIGCAGPHCHSHGHHDLVLDKTLPHHFATDVIDHPVAEHGANLDG